MAKKLLIAGSALALICSCNSMENPLLTESSAPFGAPEFDKIKNEHYLPAFEAGIAEAKAEIDAIVANKEEPTFIDNVGQGDGADHGPQPAFQSVAAGEPSADDAAQHQSDETHGSVGQSELLG